MEQAEIRLAILDLVCRTWGTIPPEHAIEKAKALEDYVNSPGPPKLMGWDMGDPVKGAVPIYSKPVRRAPEWKA